MEKLKTRKFEVYSLFATSVLAGSIILAACSDSNTNSERPNFEEVVDDRSNFTVTHEYDNDKRYTYISNVNDGYVAQGWAYCDGPDLFEYFDGIRAGGPQRTQDHPACVDGKLTAEDFSLPD